MPPPRPPFAVSEPGSIVHAHDLDHIHGGDDVTAHAHAHAQAHAHCSVVVQTCETVQVSFDAAKVVPLGANPFDTDAFLWATVAVTTQDGHTATAGLGHTGAYYHLNASTGQLLVSFKVTPTVVGIYTVAFLGPAAPVTPRVWSFTVLAGPQHCGFVVVAPNGQHFASEPDRAFFGVGENLAWVSHTKPDADPIARNWLPYLQNLSSHGANYIRVWLTDSWDDLYVESVLGNYSLANTNNIEELLAAAAANHIKVLMCIESFNLFCDATPPTPCYWGKLKRTVYIKMAPESGFEMCFAIHTPKTRALHAVGS